MGSLIVMIISTGYIYLINRQIYLLIAIQSYDVAVVIFSVMISIAYLAIIRKIMIGGWRDKVAYVIGACIGSVCAMIK